MIVILTHIGRITPALGSNRDKTDASRTIRSGRRRACGENIPHRVVCSEVLNLPSQVGILPESSALARAYRVTFASLDPRKLVLAQDLRAATRAQ